MQIIFILLTHSTDRFLIPLLCAVRLHDMSDVGFCQPFHHRFYSCLPLSLMPSMHPMRVEIFKPYFFIMRPRNFRSFFLILNISIHFVAIFFTNSSLSARSVDENFSILLVRGYQKYKRWTKIKVILGNSLEEPSLKREILSIVNFLIDFFEIWWVNIFQSKMFW